MISSSSVLNRSDDAIWATAIRCGGRRSRGKQVLREKTWPNPLRLAVAATTVKASSCACRTVGTHSAESANKLTAARFMGQLQQFHGPYTADLLLHVEIQPV